METILNIIQWVKENYITLAAIYGSLVAVATLIVKLTPSQKDDNILAMIVAFFNHFSTENPKGSVVVPPKSI